MGLMVDVWVQIGASLATFGVKADSKRIACVFINATDEEVTLLELCNVMWWCDDMMM